MGLLDIFRRKSSFYSFGLNTTPVPEGVIPHEHHGEAPWETWVDRWNTYNHPEWYKAYKNDFGSYDVIRTLGEGYEVSVAKHQSLDAALDFLIAQEARVMRKYKGFQDLKVSQLQDHVLFGEFDPNHIFTYLQENPMQLEKWLEKSQKDYKARTPHQIQNYKIAHEIKKVIEAQQKTTFSVEDLKKYIASNKFPEKHVFALIKKDQAILEQYVAETYPDASQKAAKTVASKPLKPAI